MSGKTLIPFVTHGDHGLGNSKSGLVSHAPKARFLEGSVMEADQERRTMGRVTDWPKKWSRSRSDTRIDRKRSRVQTIRTNHSH